MWFLYGPDGSKQFCVDDLHASIIQKFVRSNPQFYVAKEKHDPR